MFFQFQFNIYRFILTVFVCDSGCCLIPQVDIVCASFVLYRLTICQFDSTFLHPFMLGSFWLRLLFFSNSCYSCIASKNIIFSIVLVLGQERHIFWKAVVHTSPYSMRCTVNMKFLTHLTWIVPKYMPLLQKANPQSWTVAWQLFKEPF